MYSPYQIIRQCRVGYFHYGIGRSIKDIPIWLKTRGPYHKTWSRRGCKQTVLRQFHLLLLMSARWNSRSICYQLSMLRNLITWVQSRDRTRILGYWWARRSLLCTQIEPTLTCDSNPLLLHWSASPSRYKQLVLCVRCAHGVWWYWVKPCFYCLLFSLWAHEMNKSILQKIAMCNVRVQMYT